MDRLSNDHRTATLAGDRGARRQLEKVADRLFADLRSNERAEWVAISTGMAPALVVATDSRLLTISMIGRSTQAIERPFTIVLGKKRLIGQSVDVFDARGLCLSLLLQEPDLRALQMTGGASSPSGSTTQAPPPPPSAPPDPAGTAPPPGSTGAWRWGRPVTSWQEAELLAAAHMVDLGFSGATVTPGGADAGLDVIAHDAAAQVKYHEGPTGRPDIQRLIGAAHGLRSRIFYASSYTTAAILEADRLGVALFQFTPEGLVVAINDAARGLAPGAPAPDQRTAFGALTFESRQNRAIRWSQQIEDATKVPISDRKRRGAKQLVERQRALKLMLHGLEQLRDSDNPLYKKRRKERTLSEAEKTLKQGAAVLRMQLK
ncbi:hypothetical protein BJ993_002031 [Nocardioides aromaticivorans]|uniref:Restriction endonuclease type IV Mrr domain-containing protein n=1 Tax=Nocardioides aromaticivorans TaxID=200618 RepID=A0A7Y9ZK46_9ACTN|nr:restriction endonuclease [Nocardioides aromaticivorans]NYI44951.1 hypothetical protein [Nocardioides aromaticivorans]